MSIREHLTPTKGDKVQLLLDFLRDDDPAEHEALVKALKNHEEYSAGDIVRALAAEGLDEFKENQIVHYRGKIRRGAVSP